jgi:hypothetical protein
VERIKEIEVWVQIHNVPQEVLTLDDIELLFQSLGTLLFQVKEIHIQGRRAYKAKDMLQLDNSLRDRVEVQHPEGGVMCLPLVCEKIYRTCRFCGEVGHELGDCTSRNRLMRLSKDVEYSDRPEIHDILHPKLGPWITDYVKIPRGGLGEKTGLYQKKGTCQGSGSSQQNDEHIDLNKLAPIRPLKRPSHIADSGLNSVVGGRDQYSGSTDGLSGDHEDRMKGTCKRLKVAGRTP